MVGFVVEVVTHGDGGKESGLDVAKYMEGNGRGCYDLPPLTNDCIVILIF
jgi:hypothetical protein